MYAAWSISYLIALWSTHLLLTATEPFSKRFKWHFQRSLAVSFEYLKDTFLTNRNSVVQQAYSATGCLKSGFDNLILMV